MNVREIVNRLLEADLTSAGDATGVYIFGPGLPSVGFAAKDVNQVILHLRRSGIIPKETNDDVRMLDALVDKGYVFMIKHAPGDVEVIGSRLPVATTPEGAEQAEKLLGLGQHEAVAYRKHTTDGAQRLPVDRVLYGSKDMEQAEQERKKQGPVARVQGKRAAPARNAVKGGESAPLNAPVSVGFQYALNSQQGIQVMEVIPGGPAAQAGLQAGDTIVQTGKFAPEGGGEPVGPFYVYNTNHLAYVLRRADPRYPISFRVHRGDQDLWIPIKPELKAPVQPGTAPPRGRMAKLTGTAPLTQPNAPTPARETGNQPANISSIT